MLAKQAAVEDYRPPPVPSTAPKSFCARLLEALPDGLRQQLQHPVTYHVFVISSPKRPAPNVIPNYPDILATDRLLLLAEATSSRPSSALPISTEYVFVSALRATEYATSHIHIAKLDTSGHHAHSSLARTLATAYITQATVAAATAAYITRATVAAANAARPYISFVSKIPVTTQIISPVTTHVFARAQPAYLFAGSEHNKAKKVLSDRDLLKWWAGTLAAAAANLSEGTPAVGHWYVPGESPRSLWDVWTTMVTTVRPIVAWKWGLAPCGSGGLRQHPGRFWPERAQDVIVRFPDDARTKVLNSHIFSNTTVADLQEMLAVTGECNGRLSGFFQVELLGDERSRSSERVDSALTSWPPSLSLEAFDATEKFLMSLDFRTWDDAESSSRLLGEHLKTLGIVPITLDVKPTASAAVDTGSQPLSSPVNVPDNSELADNGHKEPKGIQNLVKRKEAPTQTGAVAANSVQNLVKRAKPASSAEPVLVQNLVKRTTSHTSAK
ncbi:hypothetical protein HDU86_001617 [Geranomyces michiganensis]|nr:hypothetical protein HDU86_001617 [Geranomyces michiganensis]